MLNRVWFGLLLAAVLLGGFLGRLHETVEAVIKAAETAVTLAIGLVGVMTLWLGMIRLADKAGLVGVIARILRPLLVRLFPEIPADHPALGSVVMNLTANMLGLSNAATPFGLRAMQDLQKLNPHPDTATNAMCTLLALNTGSIQLIPATAVALLAGQGAANPTAIVGTAFLSTACAAVTGFLVAKMAAPLKWFRIEPGESRGVSAPVEQPARVEVPPTEVTPLGGWQRGVLLAYVACFAFFIFRMMSEPVAVVPAPPTGVRFVNAVSLVSIPFLLGFFPLYAVLKKLPVYEEFIEGAKEGFQTAIRIIPYLVGMLVAIGALRGSGGLTLLTDLLRAPLALIKLPVELVPLALLRPLTGSGSLAAFGDIVKAYGPDHLLSRTAGTIYGSSEATFYVLAVYFGSVGIRRTRHALLAGLAADAVGCLAAVYICRAMFG
ncbi:MAG TPA: nucleoside recognition domain-containing protein [Candidatus Limnocylindria bacterium]|nr:nucleoside recognition domain-containing protein [Candidatus Limnocylindria bacterium]